MHEELTKPLTTALNYDPVDKAKAYELYLRSDMDLTDISITLGIEKSVISSWARRGNWATRKAELESEFMRCAESKYRTFVIEHRLPTIQRHLEICRKLEEKIAQLLEGDKIDSRELKRLSEALSSSAAVAARAAGVADRVTERSPTEPSSQSKRPLIAIGISPTLAGQGGVNARVVDTTVEDYNEQVSNQA